MQGEFTTTTADYQEAFTIHALVVPKRPSRRVVLEISALVEMALIGWLVYYIYTRPMPSVIPGTSPMMIDMEWTLIYLPPLVPALLWISHYCISLIVLRFYSKVVPERAPLAEDVRNYKYPVARPHRNRRIQVWMLIVLIVVAVASLWRYGPMIDRDLNRVPAGSSEMGITILGNPMVLMFYNAALWGAATALWIYSSRSHQKAVTFSTWKNHLASKASWTFEATELKLRGSDLTCQVEYQWSAFRRFVETENLFLLYMFDDQFHIIPKRAFSSLDDTMAFLGLLCGGIKNGLVPERRDVGFPVQLVPTAPPTGGND